MSVWGRSFAKVVVDVVVVGAAFLRVWFRPWQTRSKEQNIFFGRFFPQFCIHFEQTRSNCVFFDCLPAGGYTKTKEDATPRSFAAEMANKTDGVQNISEKRDTPCGTRTRNLRIRSPTPCPLGQGGCCSHRDCTFDVVRFILSETCTTCRDFQKSNSWPQRRAIPGQSFVYLA